ncbi:hypothetical protein METBISCDRAFT_24298 [Metschnikowia bicuspidata]|uniref:Uncharacterized protein n=1 Tax=Metschnikowia bicuspidata TaxID=27322 RepID=A0A4V1J2Q5_9ASCO|nr:hypothetical protein METBISCDRAFT_24298 [Metschnikowia bicuspidata]
MALIYMFLSQDRNHQLNEGKFGRFLANLGSSSSSTSTSASGSLSVSMSPSSESSDDCVDGDEDDDWFSSILSQPATKTRTTTTGPRSASGSSSASSATATTTKCHWWENIFGSKMATSTSGTASASASSPNGVSSASGGKTTLVTKVVSGPTPTPTPTISSELVGRTVASLYTSSFTTNGAATYVIKSTCPTIVEAQEWYCEEEEDSVFTKQAVYSDGPKTTTTKTPWWQSSPLESYDSECQTYCDVIHYGDLDYDYYYRKDEDSVHFTSTYLGTSRETSTYKTTLAGQVT